MRSFTGSRIRPGNGIGQRRLLPRQSERTRCRASQNLRMRSRTDQVGPHPWELAWKEGRWQELSPPLPAVAEFADHLKQIGTTSILDLGCGAGRHAIFLAKAGFHVTGLDVSETALAELQARLKKDVITGVMTLVKHEML